MPVGTPLRNDHPIGTPVIVVRDDQSIFHGKTNSEPYTVGNHRVVKIRDLPGCYLLKRCWVDTWAIVTKQAGDVIAANGCDCDGHNEDCDPCLACLVSAALQPSTDQPAAPPAPDRFGPPPGAVAIEAFEYREVMDHQSGKAAVVAVPAGSPPMEGQRIPDGLPIVAGDFMTTSISQHEQACRVLLMEEQEKPLPNNALIATLCESVRMGREYCNSRSATLEKRP